MRRPIALIALIALSASSACNSGAKSGRPPDGGPNLPSGDAFKDGLLHAAIKAKLAGFDIDSAPRVSVIVRAGEVILRGNVKDAATKARDVRLVREMRGVRSVTDELGVGHTGPSAAATVANAGLVAAVAAALTAQTGVNVSGVRIRADDGAVTLAGHAASAALKSTMLAVAKKTPGVRNVVDRIVVK